MTDSTLIAAKTFSTFSTILAAILFAARSTPRPTPKSSSNPSPPSRSIQQRPSHKNPSSYRYRSNTQDLKISSFSGPQEHMGDRKNFFDPQDFRSQHPSLRTLIHQYRTRASLSLAPITSSTIIQAIVIIVSNTTSLTRIKTLRNVGTSSLTYTRIQRREHRRTPALPYKPRIRSYRLSTSSLLSLTRTSISSPPSLIRHTKSTAHQKPSLGSFTPAKAFFAHNQLSPLPSQHEAYHVNTQIVVKPIATQPFNSATP